MPAAQHRQPQAPDPMLFAPCPYTRERQGWSARRLAAADRAVAREIDRTPLFPELARISTREERIAEMDAREDLVIEKHRGRYAKNWREARRLYFLLPPLRREGFRRLWALHIYPLDPAYFIEVLRKTCLRPGASPWTHLRKKRLIVAWREGTCPEPASRLAITRHFDSL